MDSLRPFFLLTLTFFAATSSAHLDASSATIGFLHIVVVFYTMGALEGVHFLATGDLVSLGEQQLLDCDHEYDPEERDSCDSGYNGGLTNNAFEYILKSGGVELQKKVKFSFFSMRNLQKFKKYEQVYVEKMELSNPS